MSDRSRLVGMIDRARTGGARAAEVAWTERDLLEQAGAKGRPGHRLDRAWTARVWRDGGRCGVATAATPEGAIDVALASSADAPPDPLAGPPDRIPVPGGSLGICDRRHEQIADEDRADMLQLAERALAQGGLGAVRVVYRQVLQGRGWMSTRGMEAEETSTAYELSAEVDAGPVRAFHRIASRHFSDVASLPFGVELRRRVEPLLRRVELPASPRPIVLDPRVMAELVRSLAPAFAADAVARGNFLASRLGKRLASPTLHVTDDAGLASGLLTRAFDERGVPPIPVAVLKEGVVSALYHDPETARAAGLRPTGHVWDGVIRPSNLVVRPGARTRNVILTELKDYLALDRLPPLDLDSGMLAGVVPVVRVDQGERVGAVDVRIEAPIWVVLEAVREMAADQERSCEVDTPTAVLDGLPLVAA